MNGADAMHTRWVSDSFYGALLAARSPAAPDNNGVAAGVGEGRGDKIGENTFSV